MRPSPTGVSLRPAPPSGVWDDADNPARKLALFAGLCLIVVRFSEFHQMTTHLTGVNFRLLYVFGLPALAGMAMSGGVRRTLQGRPASYWIGFLVCMGLAVPFSSWTGGSLGQFLSYAGKDFPMLFVIAGLIVTWRECRMLMYALAGSGVLSVANGQMFSDPGGSARLSLAFGMMANANDYACHLLLVLPFVLWLALKPGSWALTRPLAVAVAGIGVFLILRTGSRGGALALGAALLFFFWRGSARQRFALVLMAPLVLGVAIWAAPTAVLNRIRSLAPGSAASADTEAESSAEARIYVLRKSIEYTVRHPILGVGPAQFPNYEGRRERVIGTHGYYHGTHNTFTQVSSECGIPALIFFVAGLASSYRLLSATYRRARQQRECQDIETMVLCLMLGMVGFTVGMTFLNFAYFFYMPAMGGLAIAVSRSADDELKRRGSEPREPGWTPDVLNRPGVSSKKIWAARFRNPSRPQPR